MGPEERAFDADHLWHPYAKARGGTPPLPVVGAAGVRLELADGRQVIDAMSSWWSMVHGYGVPELDQAATAQLEQMSHVMFGGLTHQPAVDLGRRLLEWLPGYEQVFFADSGSVAVEVAMKMAIQATGRSRFLALRGGYHGDTWHAMSVSDPDGGMHTTWQGRLPEQVFAPRPPAAVADLGPWQDAVAELLRTHAADLAAVIVEPTLQGAGGMWMYPPEANDFLTRAAHDAGALVIHDEIATGFWRTGAPFAATRLGEPADIICVGKALTGGQMTLGATLTTAAVADRIDASPAGALMHGPTFMANPLACRVAAASLDLLAGHDNATRIAAISDGLRAGLEPAREVAGVVDVRVLGAVGVIELAEPVDLAAVTEIVVDRGVWLRPFRNLVYTMPPYVIPAADLGSVTEAMVDAVSQVAPGMKR